MDRNLLVCSCERKRLLRRATEPIERDVLFCLKTYSELHAGPMPV
jgi:hypothetical protein